MERGVRDVSLGVVILGRWGVDGGSRVSGRSREIAGDRVGGPRRSREVKRDHARSREIVGDVIRDGEGRMDVSPGVVILGRWGTRGESKVREIEGDRGRSHGRSREVQGGRARSREIVGDVIMDGEGRTGCKSGGCLGVVILGSREVGRDQGRPGEIRGDDVGGQGRSAVSVVHQPPAG